MAQLVKRSEIVAWINTTPSGSSSTWGLVGNGVTGLTYNYNAQETTETYIVNDNATTTIDSYQLALDTEMKCLKGDDVFDFINGLRYNLSVGDAAVTKVLLVDKYEATGSGSSTTFKAQQFECSISVGEYGGDGGATPTISYKINVNGQPTQGSVTITAGVPTFTATV